MVMSDIKIFSDCIRMNDMETPNGPQRPPLSEAASIGDAPPAIDRTNASTAAVVEHETAADRGLVRRRADAVHNREKLLAAAEAVFLESGVNTSLDVMADRAGVGRVTLFRNFTDRRQLLVGLLDRSLAALERQAAAVGSGADALGHLLRYAAQRMVSQGALVEYWLALDYDDPRLRTALRRVSGTFSKPVASAVKAGNCRADLDLSDIILLIVMMSGVRYARTLEAQRELVERAWQLVIAAAQLRGAPPTVGTLGQLPGLAHLAV